MQAWFLSREDPLEEGVAAHSGILAWRPPGQGTLAATVLELADSDTTQQARRQEKRLVRSACGGAGSVPGAAWRQAAALATRHPRHTLTPSRTRSLVSASAHL